jgi:hypothetical protein
MQIILASSASYFIYDFCRGWLAKFEKEAIIKMSMKVSLEEFRKLGGARKRIDYPAVKAWILEQQKQGFAVPVKTLEEKFNLRFSTFAWRANKEGDRVVSHTIKKNDEKARFFELQVGVSKPKPSKKSKKGQ